MNSCFLMVDVGSVNIPYMDPMGNDRGVKLPPKGIIYI